MHTQTTSVRCLPDRSPPSAHRIPRFPRRTRAMEEQLHEQGLALLHQLDSVLSADPLVNELGIVHPSQLATLHDTTSSEFPFSVNKSAIWCADHKLAIAAPVIGSLYTAAKSSFIIALKEYRRSIRDAIQIQRDDLVKKLLSYSRVVVVLNSSFKIAWDARKQIFGNGVPLTELGLSNLALSFNPKCEQAWAYRRWVIHGHLQGLLLRWIPNELLQAEFELIEMISERSRMNYRAWRHCCWLVPLMSHSQVLNGLQRWKRWSELHVADNCCFHFRRCLFQRLYDDELTETRSAWQDEMDWNSNLIRSYIGREALWIHRRFLFIIWNQYFKDTYVPENMTKEIKFSDQCIEICINDETEDAKRQVSYACTYKLWIMMRHSEVSSLLRTSQSWSSKELHEIQDLLGKFAPHHKGLWKCLCESIFRTLQHTD